MKKTLKRFISIVLVAVLCLAVSPLAFAAGVRGDVNNDNKVNSTDALLILRKAVGYEDENCNTYRSDLNNDGAVNSTDALRVLQMSVGSDNPTTYSKNEAIRYYSDALDSVAVGKVNVSYESRYVSKMVNDDDSTDFVDFDESSDMTDYFENGYDDVGYSIYEFCPNARIDPSLVKSAKITKRDASTYIVKIVLVEDKADDEDYVPYKTYPYLLNYADCTVSGLEDYFVYDATASFPGSEITAVVHDGCLKELVIDVPFEMHMNLEHYEDYEYVDVTEKGHVIDTYTFEK